MRVCWRSSRTSRGPEAAKSGDLRAEVSALNAVKIGAVVRQEARHPYLDICGQLNAKHRRQARNDIDVYAGLGHELLRFTAVHAHKEAHLHLSPRCQAN